MEKILYIDCFNGDYHFVLHVCLNFNDPNCPVLSCLWVLQYYDHADHRIVGRKNHTTEVERNCLQSTVYSYEHYRDSNADNIGHVNQSPRNLGNLPHSDSFLHYCSDYYSNFENAVKRE